MRWSSTLALAFVVAVALVERLRVVREQRLALVAEVRSLRVALIVAVAWIWQRVSPARPGAGFGCGRCLRSASFVALALLALCLSALVLVVEALEVCMLVAVLVEALSPL